MKAVFIRSTIGSLVILWLLGAGVGHAEETDHIKTLTVEEATRLAQQKNGRLLLDGRTTPALKAVAALAEMNGHNWNGHLPRFKAVPDGRARSIRRFRTSRENWTRDDREEDRRRHRGEDIQLPPPPGAGGWMRFVNF